MLRTSKPVLVDSSLHTAFMIKYIIYALFGLLGATLGSSTLETAAGWHVSRIVAGIVCLCSIVAAVASWGVGERPERWEKIELYSTIGVVSFVSVYCTSAVVLVMNGDHTRLNLAIIAAALVVFPTWRIIQIIRNVRRR